MIKLLSFILNLDINNIIFNYFIYIYIWKSPTITSRRAGGDNQESSDYSKFSNPSAGQRVEGIIYQLLSSGAVLILSILTHARIQLTQGPNVSGGLRGHAGRTLLATFLTFLSFFLRFSRWWVCSSLISVGKCDSFRPNKLYCLSN